MSDSINTFFVVHSSKGEKPRYPGSRGYVSSKASFFQLAGTCSSLWCGNVICVLRELNSAFLIKGHFPEGIAVDAITLEMMFGHLIHLRWGTTNTLSAALLPSMRKQ